MKRKHYLIAFLCAVFLFAGCNSEKKIVRYKGIYNEKPTFILIPNPIDKSARKDDSVNNYRIKRKNIEYNKELSSAKEYFYSNIFYPFSKKGYYVIQEYSTQNILKAEKITNSEELTKKPLQFLHQKYGVDAVLFAYILAWKDEEQADWRVFLDYQLKSAQTDSLIFQVRVKGQKKIPISAKGIITLQPQDRAFIKQMDIKENSLAQRVILLTQINNYILSNLPFGQFDGKYEQDQNNVAIGNCVEYFIDEDGGLSIVPISLEQFEQECFVF